MTADAPPTPGIAATSGIAATPVGVGTQELRVATAMTGGVSLAIWMGGVARELNLLEQASRRRDALPPGSQLPEIDDDSKVGFGDARWSQTLYLRLLDLLDVTVHVDLLSGTSAGGINAALLGFTRSRRLDLAPLRDVWLKTGSFDLLLRDPSEKSPPSLLQGDGVLLDGLRKGIGLLTAAGATSAPPAADSDEEPIPSTEVFITTTMLTGETSRFTDAFGTLVQDVDHRGVFKFDQTQLAQADGEDALALAARCSASFPAAFEPAFVQWGPDESSPPLPAGHPDMAPYVNATRSHFVADGGLMMNRPIKPLLEAVFDRPAERQVRRALLYVVPSPGDAPDPRKAPAPETYNQPYTFGGALLKDLGAALSQSISAELRALREHNDTVTGIADTRLRVAELGTVPGRTSLNLLQPAALADYRSRQSAAFAGAVMTALMRVVTTMPQSKMPESWQKALVAGSSIELECRKAAQDAITVGWPTAVPGPGDVDSIVAFGRAPYDGAKATILAMLRAGWILASSPGDRAALAAATTAVHGALTAPGRPNLTDAAADRISQIPPGSPTTLPEVAATLARDFAGTRADLLPLLAAGWRGLATALLDVAPVLSRLADAPTAPSPYEEARTAARAELHTYLEFLRNPNLPDDDPATQVLVSVDMTISSLFQLHVVVRSMLPTGVDVEQTVGIVQVSADTRCALTPEYSSAKTKLTGMQLHHFGAFYKSSWRANDWMWGRLDGAGWLVHLLLDPERILLVAETNSPQPDKRAWFLKSLQARFPNLGAVPLEVESELAYLDDPTAPVGRSLPETAMWLATAWQERVAVAELPVVAREVVLNPSLRSSTWAADVLRLTNTPESIVATVQAATKAITDGGWSEEQAKLRDQLAAVPPPSLSGPDVQGLLQKLREIPVPKETLQHEVGEPLFTRTVTKAVAVGTAATAEAQEMPAVLHPVLAVVRSATLLAYRLAAVTRGRSRALATAGAGVLLLGVALLLTSHLFLGLSGFVLVLTGVYLLLFVGWRRLEGIGQWIWYVLAGLAVAMAIALACGPVRRWLFDDGTNPGVVTEHVIPHLRSSVWLAPVVFLVVVALVAGCVYALIKKDEKKNADKKKADAQGEG